MNWSTIAKIIASVLVVNLILVAISLKSTAIVRSETAGSSSQNVHLISYYAAPTNAVAVQGDYAFLATDKRLTILDVSNPAQPVLAGQTADLPAVIQRITVVGNYAYVAAGAGGMRIVNVANPAAPAEVGAYTAPWLIATDVVVIDQTAYVTGLSGATFTIVNVANPAAPSQVGSYGAGDAYSVTVHGPYAYLALGLGAGNAWLDIVNVANAAAPFRAYLYSSPGKPRGIAIHGSYAYVAEVQNCGGGFCNPDGGGLRILNVTNPAAPYPVGHYNQTFDTADTVIVHDNRAYLAAWYDGVRVVDVTTPWLMQEAGYYQVSPGRTLDVALSDNLIFVAHDTAGLLILYFAPNFSLTINYPDGAPGSVFRLLGSGFLPLHTVEITVNGRSIGTTSTDENGEFSILLSTPLADAGVYFITAATGPIQKSVSLTLDPTLPIRPQDGGGPVLEIPAGIAFTEFNYLPLVRR